MRHTPSPEPGASTPTSWQAWKARANSQFERGDFEGALTSYGAVLNPDLYCPDAERAIILSNMVACRLKIGGTAQARAAVENAKQSIAINDSWSKAHVRLASSYIALGGHSNDACNALQRALRLDPGNSTARQMLLRELRRDAAQRPAPSAPPEEFDDNHIGQRPRPSAPAEEYDGTSNNNRQRPDHDRVDDEIRGGNIDDGIPMRDRFTQYTERVYAWYSSLSPDMRSFLKVVLLLLVLYIGLGGRFGFEGPGSSRATGSQRGKYDAGNAYDEYYTEKKRERRLYSNSYGQSYSHHGYNRRSGDYYRSNYGDNHHSDSGHQSRQVWGLDIADGSLLSMALIAGVVFMCYRLGLNPLEVFFYLNIFGMGPRGMGMQGMHFRRRGFGAGFGRGGFGFGGGGFHQGRRNRWF